MQRRNLFSVKSFRSVEGLDERGGVTDKHSVARGTGQHADHGQPDVRSALWWIPTVANTQHV